MDVYYSREEIKKRLIRRLRISSVRDADLILDILDELQPADVRENVHGKWIEIHNPSYSPFDGSPSTFKICSVCESVSERETRYCQNCGADMRENT